MTDSNPSDTTSDSMAAVISVSELSDQIDVTDREGTLTCSHYVSCSDNSPQYVKNARGVIKDGDKVVCQSFPFTPEYSSDNPAAIRQVFAALDLPWSQFSFTVAEEGTLLRVWYDSANTWHVSTHRKIDAFNSRWGSVKSYGDLFTEALRYYENSATGTPNSEQLENDTHNYVENKVFFQNFFNKYFPRNTGECHAFLLRSTKENRIVSNPAPPERQVTYVGRFLLTDDKVIRISCYTLGIFPLQEELRFSNCDEMLEYVTKCHPSKAQGVMVSWNMCLPTFGYMKITNSDYLRLAELRGNNPSLITRYLQVRCTPLYDAFIALYPERQLDFMTCELRIDEMVEYLYNSYVERFITRQSEKKYPPPVWRTIQHLHNMYFEDRYRYRITRRLVRDYINDLPGDKLRALISSSTMQQREVN